VGLRIDRPANTATGRNPCAEALTATIRKNMDSFLVVEGSRLFTQAFLEEMDGTALLMITP
jgi:hypothetical protein